jgi:PhnB protein
MSWFGLPAIVTRPADGGTVVDDLQQRPWGAFDGQLIDRYGVHWLIGFEVDTDG